MYGSGVTVVDIVYRSGRENVGADALSRGPCHPPPTVGIAEGEVQVAAVTTENIPSLLRVDPVTVEQSGYSEQQQKDPELRVMIQFLDEGKLPEDLGHARKLVIQEQQFSLIDKILYYVDHQHNNRKKVAVPKHLREKLIHETHGGTQGGALLWPQGLQCP